MADAEETKEVVEGDETAAEPVAAPVKKSDKPVKIKASESYKVHELPAGTEYTYTF